MSYIRIFISWFLEHFTSEDVSMVQLIVTLGLACVVALYLFFVYRILARKTFYAKRYNITLSAVVVITTAIIFTVQSNVVLSLGVVGALAVVRFRTALKEPLDIVFLFWAVTVGVCCGAHMAEIAIILSAILTVVILGLEGLSIKQGYRLLIIECDNEMCETEILGRIKESCKRCKVRKRSLQETCIKLVMEVVVKQEFQMMQKLKGVSGIKSLSLIAHEGEHNY